MTDTTNMTTFEKERIAARAANKFYQAGYRIQQGSDTVGVGEEYFDDTPATYARGRNPAGQEFESYSESGRQPVFTNVCEEMGIDPDDPAAEELSDICGEYGEDWPV